MVQESFCYIKFQNNILNNLRFYPLYGIEGILGVDKFQILIGIGKTNFFDFIGNINELIIKKLEIISKEQQKLIYAVHVLNQILLLNIPIVSKKL